MAIQFNPLPKKQVNVCEKCHIYRRYAAYAFDWTLIATVVGWLPGDWWVGIIFWFVLGWSYFVFSESSSYQATPGKYLVGLRVENMHGQRLDWIEANNRFWAGTASWVTLNIGHLIANWRADGRALHDLIANTRVCAENDQTIKYIIISVALLLFHVGMIIYGTLMSVHKAIDSFGGGMGISPNMIFGGKLPL